MGLLQPPQLNNRSSQKLFPRGGFPQFPPVLSSSELLSFEKEEMGGYWSLQHA